MLSSTPAISLAGISPADLGFDLIDQFGSLFNPSATACPQVQAELACVDAGEEILPELRDQEHGSDAEQNKECDKGKPEVQDRPQPLSVGMAETGEAPFKLALDRRERPQPQRNSASVCRMTT